MSCNKKEVIYNSAGSEVEVTDDGELIAITQYVYIGEETIPAGVTLYHDEAKKLYDVLGEMLKE